MIKLWKQSPRRLFGRFDPDIWVITGISFLNTFGLSIGLPFLSLYLYQERGLSMTLIGTIILVSGLGTAVVQMLAGALADRLGRRPLLLSAVAASVLLYLVMAVLIAVSASVVAITLAFIAARAALMMMRPAVQAMVTDLTPKDRLTEAYGLLRVGINLGWAAGPALGGYLAAWLPYAWLFGAAALTGTITFAVIFAFLQESFCGALAEVNFRGMFQVARDRPFLEFNALCLLIFLVMGQMVSTLSVFTVDRAGFSTIQYGLLLTLNGAMVVLFQYPVARWLGRVGKRTVLMMGSLLYGLGYLSIGWDTGFVFGLASMAVITCGEITFSPTSQAVAGELSPPDWRGRYMGFFSLSETLGMSLGPLLGGILLDSLPQHNQLLWGIIGLVAFLAAFGFHRWCMTEGAATVRRP